MADTQRKSPKRLLIDLTEEQHGLFKERAARRGITLRKWVMRALIEQIKKEDSYTK